MGTQKSRIEYWRSARLISVLADVVSFLNFALRRFFSDGMSQAAAALTYSTLLALVPLLVIAFSILSGFPIFEPVEAQMEELLLGVVVPSTAIAIKAHLADFTRNASNLTAAGIVALPVTAVLLLSTIETTLNRVWRVDTPRPLLTRLLVFWALLTFGPLLLGASLTLTTDMMSFFQGSTSWPEAVLGPSWLKAVFAVVTQAIAFSMLYILIPARRVTIRDAAIGGAFAAVGFQVLRWVFDTFLTSGASYTTIYGAVAVVPIFLVWMYLAWTVIILGAVLAASFPDWWRRRDPLTGIPLSQSETLEVAMALLAALKREAAHGGTVTQDQLADAVPLLARETTLDALLKAQYVVEAKDGGLSLARDLHAVSLAQLARDLGLSLGRSSGAAERPALKRLTVSSRLLPDLLASLHRAEDEIMGVSIADALEGGRSAAQLQILRFTSRQTK
jgi:membrane protein